MSTTARCRRWRERNREHVRLYWRAWRRANRAKHSAHRQLRRAVRLGLVVRPDRCDGCGEPCRPDGHHHRGYADPLRVRWLCKACHAAANVADH